MNERDERYRDAATKLLAKLEVSSVIVHIDVRRANVQVLNPSDRNDVGDGAFVEALIWVPAAMLKDAGV